MSAIIEITDRMTVRSGDANLIDVGSAVVPTTPTGTTCDGTPFERERQIVLEPGDSFTLWDWATMGDMALMRITSDGYVWIEQYVDLPTSGSDFTPVGGTSKNHPKDALSCIGPRYIEGMAVPTVPSTSNYAASAFHATTANGRRYSVSVKNPSDATANVTVRWSWTK